MYTNGLINLNNGLRKIWIKTRSVRGTAQTISWECWKKRNLYRIPCFRAEIQILDLRNPKRKSIWTL